MNILILLFSVLSFAAAERKLDAQFLTYKATASGSSSPSSGFETCYVKTDGFMYCKTSAGVEHRMQDSGQNSIKITDAAGTYTYEIRGATPSGNIVWDLPNNNGAGPDYFLKNNGSGLLSWASPSGSSSGRTAAFSFGGASENSACSSDPCTVYRSKPAGVTVARGSSGNYTANFGSFFTNKPICGGSVYGTGFSVIRIEGHSSANSLAFSHFTSGAAADGAGEITCIESE